jgi:hypothetical protein
VDLEIAICAKPVVIGQSKTDGGGKAVHEKRYASILAKKNNSPKQRNVANNKKAQEPANKSRAR